MALNNHKQMIEKFKPIYIYKYILMFSRLSWPDAITVGLFKNVLLRMYHTIQLFRTLHVMAMWRQMRWPGLIIWPGHITYVTTNEPTWITPKLTTLSSSLLVKQRENNCFYRVHKYNPIEARQNTKPVKTCSLRSLDKEHHIVTRRK